MAVAIPCAWVALGAASASALSPCVAGAHCPTARDDSYKMTLGGTLAVGAPGLLANDSGDPGTTVDLVNTDTTTWNNATVAVRADGSFTYKPDVRAAFTGVDSFDYYIQDQHGRWDVATANIEVDPVIRDDSYSMKPNSALSISAPGVFGNDRGYDNTSLTYDNASVSGGDVTVNDNGSFDYKPPKNFKGTDSFTYTVSDMNGDNTFTATVHVAVGSSAPATNPPSAGGGNPANTTAPIAGSGPGDSSQPNVGSVATPATGSPGGMTGATQSTAKNPTSAGTRTPGDSSTTSPGRLPVSGTHGSRAGPISAAIAVAAAAGAGTILWRRRRKAPATAARPKST